MGGGMGPPGGGGMLMRGRFTREDEEKMERKVSDSVLLRRLLTYLAYYRGRVIGLLGIMLGSSFAGLVSPLMTKIVLDNYITPGMVTGDTAGLNLWLAGMAALVVSVFGLNYGREYLIAWVGSKIVYTLRKDMTAQIQAMSIKYFAEGETGRIMSRVTNDVEELTHFLGMHLVSVVSDVIVIVGALALMLSFSVQLTLISFASMPVMFVMPWLMRRYMRRAWRQTRVKLAGMTSVVQESVSGMRVVQAFTQEGRDAEMFNMANQETVQARLRATLIGGLFGIGVGFGQVIGTVALLWFGAVYMLEGVVTFGTFVAFQSMVMSFWHPLMQVANFYNDFQNAMASSERIFELLDLEEEVKEAPEAERVVLEKALGRIDYENVSFAYDPTAPVLKDVTLHVAPNEKVALVGPTGAGKTTMINLLCRFYDPQKGAIMLDGVDLRKLSLRSLRTKMGIVLQDTFLFQGTVKDNIRYGRPDATDEEIYAAARAVNAHDFIMRLPQGYDTVIREGSANISIGQRQLITFSRALLVDPRILILDEATSSVDPYTELIIQKGLETLLQNRTSIVIAHRLSTVRNSDKIVVIDQGEILEMGKHEELLEKGGLYQTLYLRQFRDEAEPDEVKGPVAGPQRGGGVMGMHGGSAGGVGMQGAAGIHGGVSAGGGVMRGAPRDPRFAALMPKMQEFRSLMQEKEAQGFDVSEFRQMAMGLMGSMQSGDVEGVSRKLDDALTRLRGLAR